LACFIGVARWQLSGDRGYPTDLTMKTVFISGRFNVLHPGHVRLLQFARECGDRLVVGVESDALAGSDAHVPEDLRLEGVRSCSFVDEAFLLRESIVDTILTLRPAIVVKGREHERRHNDEKSAVESYGGKLLFSSGEVAFTSRDLIRREFSATTTPSWGLPRAFMARHGISVESLRERVKSFGQLRVLIVGDLIVDEYITCDPLGMSQEDPTLVVKPVDSKRFVGGAGIVAAHAAGLGASSRLLSVVGPDEEARFALDVLGRSRVEARFLPDATRPTTLKTRYRCQGKTLLRVSRLHQSAVAAEFAERLVKEARSMRDTTDLVIFSDFNYGVLPQAVVDDLTGVFRGAGAALCADSQSSSQFGDVSRFRGMDLLTPTEREARLSVRNTGDGLAVLGETLRSVASAKHLILKLGEEGALVCPEPGPGQPWPPDRIEALNSMPKDVAGAGDSMLIAAGMALAVGANIWEAACLGSMAAAIQVGRVGNTPISIDELRAGLAN
jgi:rfaE bifunctional protein kinase chain/domain